MSAVLIVTGFLTAAAGIGLFAPRALSSVVLGMKTNDPTTMLVVRHWSLLLAVVGGLLIYAAYNADARVPIMVAATIEKLAFATLVVASPLRKRLIAVTAAGADVVMALLYVYFLVGPNRF